MTIDLTIERNGEELAVRIAGDCEPACGNGWDEPRTPACFIPDSFGVAEDGRRIDLTDEELEEAMSEADRYVPDYDAFWELGQ